MFALCFTASWGSVTGATGYRLDVSTSSTFSSFVSGYNNLSVPTTSAVVIGLGAVTTYYYRVRSVNSNGSSANSATKTVITAPSKPAGHPATNVGSSYFTISWNPVSGVPASNGYRLDLSSTSSFSTFLPGFNNLPITGTSYSVTNITSRTKVYYRVRAVNSAGTPSANSDYVLAVDYDNNFIETTNITVPGKTTEAQIANATINEKSTSYSYFDGLGRSIQTVNVQASPSKKDLVQTQAYDEIGREVRKYLPYTDGNDGMFKPDALRTSGSSNYSSGKQYAFYQTGGVLPSDQAPFAVTVFEASPLNRVMEQGAPGTVWQPDVINSYTSNTDRTVKLLYQGNIANEVMKWTYTPPDATYLLGKVNSKIGSSIVYYPQNQLRKTSTKDEHFNEVIEFTDNTGKVILKKVQAPAGQWAQTYYIYDNYDNLVCVLPPQAIYLLATKYHQSGATDATKETFLKSWAFRYRYDERKRVTIKQVPAAEPVYMVYDKRDRLVATQDGNQRSGPIKYWSFTKYDETNRPILTGIKDTSVLLHPDSMQSAVNKHYAKSWTKLFEQYVGNVGGSVHAYTNKSYPVLTTNSALDLNRYLTVTYYDDYRFKSSWATVFNYKNESLSETIDLITYSQPTSENALVKGQVTGAMIKILDGGIAGGTSWLKSVSYYDDKYRPIQNVTSNAIGGTDRITSLFDFTKLIRSKTVHNEGTGGVQTVERKYNFDHAGRLLKSWHKLNTGGWKLLAMNEYNELGQLIDKKLHNEDPESAADGSRLFKQSVDYNYNIRGWLTKVNDLVMPGEGDLFTMSLNYNTPTINGGAPQFNGNISEILWKSADGQNQSYGYTYDVMNRLGEAKYYNTLTAKNNRFNEKIANGSATGYDLNGNILYLQRNGRTGVTGGVTTYGAMDNLTYTYNGTRLMKVADAAVATEGFVNGTNSGDDYAYDDNGNMFKDQNKLITDGTTGNGNSRITYNFLNLVEKVVKSDGRYLRYIYDATGRKLSQMVYAASGALEKRTDYAGEFVYEGTGSTSLVFINHEEGRIIPNGSEYQYHLKDHLGNIRVTFTTKLETDANLATFEPSNSANETANFLRVQNARKVQYFAFDRTNGGSPTTVTGYAQRLSGGTNEKYGLARSISVMPGDKINAEVYAKYVDPVSGNRTAALNTFISQVATLISSGNTSSGTVIDGGGFTSSTSSFPFAGHAATNTSGSSGTGPKAFLNWLVFDRDYNLITSKSGYRRISATPKETGQDVAHERLFSPEITIDVAGYVYVFLSNEETTPIDVYFDDFKVTQVKSPVVQMDDYYPFGLTFNSYTRENTTPQDFKYQSWETQDELNLNIYSTEFRTYEPTLGRWMQIDPKANEFHSPYVGMGNNPVRYIDPRGDTIIVLNAQNSVKGAGHAAVLIGNDTDGYKLYSKNGTASSRSTNEGEGVSSSSGESTDDDEGVPFKSLEEFANSKYNQDEDGNQYYTRGYLIPSDQATDQKATEGAQKQLDKSYNVAAASCIDVCSDALKNAGFNPGYQQTQIMSSTTGMVTSQNSLSPLPNIRYDNIVKNNPGGTNITNLLNRKK